MAVPCCTSYWVIFIYLLNDRTVRYVPRKRYRNHHKLQKIGKYFDKGKYCKSRWFWTVENIARKSVCLSFSDTVSCTIFCPGNGHGWKTSVRLYWRLVIWNVNLWSVNLCAKTFQAIQNQQRRKLKLYACWWQSPTFSSTEKFKKFVLR